MSERDKPFRGITSDLAKHIIHEARIQEAIFANHEPTANLLEVNNRINNEKTMVLIERLQQLEAKVSLECRWTKQILGTYDGYDSWSTSCGEVFAIAEEWHERLSTFCSHCGGKTVDVTPKDSEVGDE